MALLCVVYGDFCALIGELSSWEKDCISYSPKYYTICYMVFNKKSLSASCVYYPELLNGLVRAIVYTSSGVYVKILFCW